MKKCTECQNEKQIGEFYFNKTKGSYFAKCKDCLRQKQKDWRNNNPSKVKEYHKKYRYHSNKVYVSKKSIPDTKLCNKCQIVKKSDQFQYLKNMNKLYSICKKCKKDYNNKYIKTKSYREKQNKYIKNKRLNNPQFRISSSLRARMRNIMIYKTLSSKELIGCNWEYLKLWLDYQFKSDMNWDNYATLWEIDHCKPCHSYDLTDETQQKLCFHWSNLRPSYCKDNRLKSDKIDLELIQTQELKKINFLKMLEGYNSKNNADNPEPSA